METPLYFIGICVLVAGAMIAAQVRGGWKGGDE